jgi:hypothetical protein
MQAVVMGRGRNVGNVIVWQLDMGIRPPQLPTVGQGRRAGLMGAIVVLNADRNAVGQTVTYVSLRSRRDWGAYGLYLTTTPEPRSGV